jgi:cytochrome P450
VAPDSKVWISSSAAPRKSLTDLADMTAISTNHDAHRRLRMPLEKLFARHSILKIEPRVMSRTEKLCARLESYRGSGEAPERLST